MDKETEILISKHYRELKNKLYIEKVIGEETPVLYDKEQIEYLEKLITAYEKLFPHLNK